MKPSLVKSVGGLCLVSFVVAFLMQANADMQRLVKRLTESERRALLDEIRSALKTQTGWTRIRAGEALIGQGHPDEALSVMGPLADTAPSQERIGVWRVVARAEPTEAGRQKMIERIWQAFLDENGPDRLHAVEALAKLHVNIPENRKPAVEEFARRPAADAAFARWLLAASGDAQAQQALVETLKDRDPIARLRASYSLSQLPRLADGTRAALLEAARAEPGDSPAFLTVVAAGANAAEAREGRERLRTKLVEGTRAADPEGRRQAATYLGDVGGAEDQPALAALSGDAVAAVRMAAANSRLKIDARSQH